MAAPQHRAPRRVRRRVLAAVQQDAHARGGEAHRRRWSISRPALAVGALLAVVVIAVGAIVIGNSGSSTRVFAAKVIGERGSAKVAVTDGRAHLIVRDFAPSGGQGLRGVADPGHPEADPDGRSVQRHVER